MSSTPAEYSESDVMGGNCQTFDFKATATASNSEFCWVQKIGYKWVNNNWVELDNWPKDREVVLVTFDLCIADHGDSGENRQSAFDVYTYLWTPGDERLYKPYTKSGSTRLPGYLGRIISLTHASTNSTAATNGEWRAVAQGTLIVPKGSYITFRAGSSAAWLHGSGVPYLKHQNIITHLSAPVPIYAPSVNWPEKIVSNLL